MVVFRLLVSAGLSLVFASSALASSITYSVMSLGGTSWRYDYTLVNDPSSVSIDEFSIYFPEGLYENLSLALGPADWDLLALQPDPFLPADGIFDGLAVGTPLAAGQSLSGFSIVFDFLGIGTPGSQFFEFLDSSTLVVIADGITQVPEPSSSALIATGFVLGLVITSVSRRPRSSLNGS